MSNITKLDREQIFLAKALVDSASAIRCLDEAVRLTTIRETDGGHEVREFLGVIHQIRLGLHYAASVSRIFWPPAQKAKARGASLRQLAGLPDQHPLADRRLRNSVEHFDERLDEWTKVSSRTYTHHEFVLYPDIQPSQDSLDSFCMIYDVARNEIRILGDTFSLTQLREQLKEVQDAASSALSQFYK